MKASQAMLRLRNGWSVDDKVCLWSWFSSVQAATHNKYEDRTRTAHHSGWDVPFWFAVSSPLLGVLVALLALAIFCQWEKQPRITRIKRIGRNLRFIRGTHVTCRAVASREGGSAVRQFFIVFWNAGRQRLEKQVMHTHWTGRQIRESHSFRSNRIASPRPLPRPQVSLAFGGCLARAASSSLTFQTSFSEISAERPSSSARQSDPSDALVAKVIDPAW